MVEKLKSLCQNEGFIKYFKNTSWLFAEKVVRMMVGLFVGIWVARYLGPERFGLLSYAQSFVGLFTAFATLGLNGIVVRELVKDQSKRDILLGTTFRLKIIGAITVLLFLAIAINFTDNDRFANLLVFIIASATIFQTFNVVDLFLQSKVISKYAVYSNVISLLITSIIKVVLILYEAPLIYFAFVILIDSIILAIGYLYFYRILKLSIRDWKYQNSLAKLLLRDSWPLMISAFMISIYQQLDQIMLKNMINAKEVGLYAAATKINALFYFIPTAILSSISPAIVSAKLKSEKLYLERLQSVYDFFSLYSYLVIIGVLFFTDFVINIMYGADYQRSSILLKIIVFSNIFSLLGATSSMWFINSGFEYKIMHRNLFGVFFNIVGNILLIPHYGAVGAALTTILAQFSANFVFDLFDRKTLLVFQQKRDSLILRNYFNLGWRYFKGNG